MIGIVDGVSSSFIVALRGGLGGALAPSAALRAPWCWATHLSPKRRGRFGERCDPRTLYAVAGVGLGGPRRRFARLGVGLRTFRRNGGAVSAGGATRERCTRLRGLGLVALGGASRASVLGDAPFAEMAAPFRLSVRPATAERGCGGDDQRQRTISRVLFLATVARREVGAIPLGHALLRASSDHPGASGGQPSSAPCSILLRVRFTDHDVTAAARGLLPHGFTLTSRAERGCPPPAQRRGIVSVALSLGLLPLDVIQHPALRSPDFPPDFAARRLAATSFLSSDSLFRWRWSIGAPFGARHLLGAV
jgi:hypothetical protein